MASRTVEIASAALAALAASRSRPAAAEAALRVVASTARRGRHDPPDRRRARLGRDDRAGQPGSPQGPHQAELRDEAQPRRRARGAGARPRARVPAGAARGGEQPEDPAHGSGLHRRVDLRPAARGPDQPESLAGGAAPARKSRISTSIRCGQADGQGDRRGARARRSGGRVAPTRRASTRFDGAARRQDRRVGGAWRRRCAVSRRSPTIRIWSTSPIASGSRWSEPSRRKPGVPATPGHLEELVESDEARAGEARDPRGRLRAVARADGGRAHGRAGRHHLHAGGRPAGHADATSTSIDANLRALLQAVQGGTSS